MKKATKKGMEVYNKSAEKSFIIGKSKIVSGGRAMQNAVGEPLFALDPGAKMVMVDKDARKIVGEHPQFLMIIGDKKRG